MDRSREIELIRECLTLAQDKAQFMPSDEARVPVASYTDAKRFTAELDALFRSAPNLLAHSTELPEPGSFVTRMHAGVPVLLVRDVDGSAKAFLNVCRHRGMTVELREQGQCKRFVCPYHAWTYETDGSLASLRLAKGFPSLEKDEISLVKLPTFEAEGFVWVVPDAESIVEFADWLPRQLLDEIRWLGCADLEIFETTTRTWRANWKLIADGGLESYHFRVAHKNTIGPYFVDTGSTYELIGNHTRTVLPRRTMLDLRERPEDEWRLRGCSNILYSLFPSASLLVQEDHVVLVRTSPVSVDETRIQVSTLGPKRPHSDDVKKHYRLNHEITITTLDEDFVIAEQIQQGLRSGANTFFRLGRYEAAIAKLHEKIDRVLTRHGAE